MPKSGLILATKGTGSQGAFIGFRYFCNPIPVCFPLIESESLSLDLMTENASAYQHKNFRSGAEDLSGFSYSCLLGKTKKTNSHHYCIPMVNLQHLWEK